MEVIRMFNKKINIETKQLLIGSILGDGKLQIQKNGLNANFSEIHSKKQKEYILWKKEFLECFQPKIKEYKILDKRTNKEYPSVVLWTKVHPLLTEYFRLFYPQNKKTISKKAIESIGPLALAVWYCDDGSFGYTNQNGKIATYVSYEKNMVFVKFLKEKFNINCTVNRDGKNHHIYFSKKEILKFLELIKDHVPECMNYKLGPLSDENLKRIEKENLKRRARDKKRWKNRMEDPLKREKIKKQRREAQKRRLKDPEYRKKYNEYHKFKEREYRKKKK
jgi:hypothetical protein